MSITAQNLSYLQQGPTATGQQLGQSAVAVLEVAFIGKATFTGDGSTTSATLNYIDGNNSIPFQPSAIDVFRIGGTDTATTIPTYAADNGGIVFSATVDAGGSGYAINDVGTISGGSGTATYQVTGIQTTILANGSSTAGVVTKVNIIIGGTTYFTATGASTTATSGSGSGLTLNTTCQSLSATVHFSAAPGSSDTNIVGAVLMK